MHEVGVGPKDTVVMTFDATRILGIHTTSPTPASTSTSTSNSTSKSTSISISTSTSISASTATYTTTSTTVSTTKSAITSTSTVTSATTSVMDSVTEAIEPCPSLEPSGLESPRDIKSRRASKSKAAVKSQATLQFPVPSDLPMPGFTPSDGFDWATIYEHGKEQKHPFNLTSKSELEDLQRATAGSLGLRRELRDIAKAQPKCAAQANGLGEVLTFVAIAPLRNMSKIVMELQDRFVEYNANKPHRASDSMQMGPFIEDALARLELTKPGAEGLSPSAKQAYLSMANITRADPQYCFNQNCEWRARVLDRWQDVNRKRDFFTARLSEVNEQLLATDEAEWQTVLWAIKTFMWVLPAYTVLLILGRLVTRGWPYVGGTIYPLERDANARRRPASRAAPAAPARRRPAARAAPAAPAAPAGRAEPNEGPQPGEAAQPADEAEPANEAAPADIE
ncbi:hypothetical protein F5B21DRAFT_509787 [Xylaria acuta]|nr:hypothetical protein F5B21DRAFT_509787 [Xylaria acuta]